MATATATVFVLREIDEVILHFACDRSFPVHTRSARPYASVFPDSNSDTMAERIMAIRATLRTYARIRCVNHFFRRHPALPPTLCDLYRCGSLIDRIASIGLEWDFCDFCLYKALPLLRSPNISPYTVEEGIDVVLSLAPLAEVNFASIGILTYPIDASRHLTAFVPSPGEKRLYIEPEDEMPGLSDGARRRAEFLVAYAQRYKGVRFDIDFPVYFSTRSLWPNFFDGERPWYSPKRKVTPTNYLYVLVREDADEAELRAKLHALIDSAADVYEEWRRMCRNFRRKAERCEELFNLSSLHLK